MSDILTQWGLPLTTTPGRAKKFQLCFGRVGTCILTRYKR
jgi:hypothetical protein